MQTFQQEYQQEIGQVADLVESMDYNAGIYSQTRDGIEYGPNSDKDIVRNPEAWLEETNPLWCSNELDPEQSVLKNMEEMHIGRINIFVPDSYADVCLDYKAFLNEEGEAERYWEINDNADRNQPAINNGLRRIEDELEIEGHNIHRTTEEYTSNGFIQFQDTIQNALGD